jgi:hypothetical protein
MPAVNAADALPPGENSPSKLVLFAAIQMVQQYNLPGVGRLRTLVRHPEDELRLRKLSKEYGRLAISDILSGGPAQDGGADPDYDPAILLVRSVVAATTVVWKIREVAQGGLAASPSMEVWELFAMIATVAYDRARSQGQTLGMIEFVATLAQQIAEL